MPLCLRQTVPLLMLLAISAITTGCASMRQSELAGLEGFEKLSAAENENIRRWEEGKSSENEVHNLRSLAKVDLSHRDSHYSLKQIVIFEQPDSARIELLRPGINQTESILIAQGGEVSAYSVSRNTVYRSNASMENMYRLIGLPFTPEELMLWLTGKFKKSEEAVCVESANKGNSSYLVSCQEPTGRVIRVLCRQVENDVLRVERLEVEFAEKLIFVSSFKYLEGAPLQVPQRIEFELPQLYLDGVLSLDAPSYNFGLSVTQREKLFTLRVPASATVRAVEDMQDESLLMPGM